MKANWRGGGFVCRFFLARRPDEPLDEAMLAFYRQLLETLGGEISLRGRGVFVREQDGLTMRAIGTSFPGAGSGTMSVTSSW